jgi:hypothetical protein
MIEINKPGDEIITKDVGITNNDSNRLFLIVLAQIVLSAFLLNYTGFYIGIFAVLLLGDTLLQSLSAFESIVLSTGIVVIFILAAWLFTFYMYKKADKGGELRHRLRIVCIIAAVLAVLYTLLVIALGFVAAIGSTGFR